MSFPKYSDYQDTGFEWLGKLPSHWNALPNKVAFQRVKTEVGSEWSNTQLLSLTLRGVITRDIHSGDGKYPADFSNYQIVEPNDLVFCLFDMDETPRTVGLSGDRGMITSAYDVFRCNPISDPAFVCYFYRYVDSHKGLRPFYTGLRKTVRTPTFLSIKMPIPPLSEQRTIAGFLDTETSKIDGLVSEQRRLIGLLKEKRQAVISHAVTKGLDPNVPMKSSGIEWLGDVPEHWKVASVGHRYEIRVGKMLDSAKIKGTHLKPYLRVADVQWGEIKTNDLPQMDFDVEAQEKFRLSLGDLLVNEGGSYVGRSAIWRGELDECYYQKALHRLRPFNRSTDSSEFFFYVMLFATKFGVFVAGGNHNTIEHLPAVSLRKYRFAFPPLEDQSQIASFLDEKTAVLDTLSTEAEQAIELLQERRTALISAAVTGKIDVRWHGQEVGG